MTVAILMLLVYDKQEFPLEDIKDMLGHKNVKTTEIYAHVSPEVKERAVNKLELYQMQHKKSGN